MGYHSMTDCGTPAQPRERGKIDVLLGQLSESIGLLDSTVCEFKVRIDDVLLPESAVKTCQSGATPPQNAEIMCSVASQLEEMVNRVRGLTAYVETLRGRVQL